MRKLIPIVIVVIVVGLGAFIWRLTRPQSPTAPQESITVDSSTPLAPVATAEHKKNASTKPPTAAATADDSKLLRIVGTATDAKTKQPVAEATISVRRKVGEFPFEFNPGNNDQVPSAKSDTTGAFALQIERGKFDTLTCRAKGYPVTRLALPSTLEAEITMNFELRPGGVISGTVKEESSGEALAGVTVRAMSAQSSLFDFAMAQRMPGRQNQATTEADGTYTIEGLEPGIYRVTPEARRKGFLLSTDSAVVVDLKEGATRDHLDFTLERGAVVKGVVRDSTGAPVAKASVNVIPAQVILTAFKGLATQDLEVFSEFKDTTDESGAFEIAGLDFDTDLRMKADAKDYAESFAEPFRIARAESPATVDIVLSTGSSISGKAHYTDGAPAKGLPIMLMPRLSEMMSGLMRDPKNTTTAADGGFVFDKIGAGHYTLQQSRMPFMIMTAEGTQVQVEVDGIKDIKGVNLPIDRATAAKTAQEEGSGVIEGSVVDAAGAPVAGVRVDARRSDRRMQTAGATTAADGTFKLEKLRGPNQDVSSHNTTGRAEQRNVPVGSKITLKLEPPASVSGTVVDAKGQPVVSCRVSMKSQDKSLPDMPLMAMMGGMFAGGQGSKTTDANGFFEFPDVNPGQYVIMANSSTKGTASSSAIRVQEGASIEGVRITLNSGVRFSGTVVDKDGQPVPGAMIKLSAAAETNLEEIAAQFMPPGLERTTAAAASGADGHFSMDQIAPGAYTLIATHGAFARLVLRDVQVAAGRDTTGYRVVMTSGGSATGQFTVAGVAQSGALVNLIGPTGMFVVSTDQDGRFDMSGIPAGSYLVSGYNLDNLINRGAGAIIAQIPQVADITDNSSTPINIGAGAGTQDSAPETTTTVNGLLQLPSGSENNITVVSLRKPGGPNPEDINSLDLIQALNLYRYYVGGQQVGADGSFSMDGIKPGNYILEAYSVNIDLQNPNLNALSTMNRTPVVRQDITVGADPVSLTLTPTAPKS